MELSIIIVNWNAQKILADCLKSIFACPPQFPFEVIVIDNGSTDGSVEMVKKNFPRIFLIANSDNRGFAKANNQGIRQAKGRYVLLLNSDTLVEKTTFDNLIEFTQKHPRAGIVGGKLLNKDGTAQPSTGKFYTLPVVFLMLFFEHWFSRLTRKSPDRPTQVDWVMGACLLITRPALDKAGLLDENFFMYIEETEWCHRVKKAGFEIWFTPTARVYHLFGGSSPSGRRFAIINIYKGLIYYYQKHFSKLSLIMLKLLLGSKAMGTFLIARLTGNQSLKETYAEALNLVR